MTRSKFLDLDRETVPITQKGQHTGRFKKSDAGGTLTVA
jgi:hypothetical protein